MSVMRSVLLAGSESACLRRQGLRFGFVRKSVARFMPGKDIVRARHPRPSVPSTNEDGSFDRESSPC